MLAFFIISQKGDTLLFKDRKLPFLIFSQARYQDNSLKRSDSCFRAISLRKWANSAILRKLFLIFPALPRVRLYLCDETEDLFRRNFEEKRSQPRCNTFTPAWFFICNCESTRRLLWLSRSFSLKRKHWDASGNSWRVAWLRPHRQFRHFLAQRACICKVLREETPHWTYFLEFTDWINESWVLVVC